MRRVFYWVGTTLCIAVGIGVYQMLQHYYGAFAEVAVGQIVLAEDTISDVEPALDFTPNEAKEDAESSNDDRASSKAGAREEANGEKVPVTETSPANIASTLQNNSASPSERDESSVDTDQKPENSHDLSKLSGEHNYYGEGADGRRAFGGWYGGPFPTPKAREGGIWSKGVGITWSKDRDVLRGFSQTLGDWATIRIKPPERVIPIVGANVAAVSVGSNMAAFSGVTCTWDLLKPSQPFTSQPGVGPDLVTIRSADHIYTFAAALGKWTSPTDDTLRRATTTDITRPVGSNANSGQGSDDKKKRSSEFNHVVVDPAPEQEALWADGVGLKWSKDKAVLYGYSFVIGEWIALHIGPQDRIVPKVYGTVATVQDKNGIAAFSGISGGWDRLELSEPFTVQPRFVDDLVRLKTKDQIYVFAAHYGKWTSPVDASINAQRSTHAESMIAAMTATLQDHHNDGHSIAQLEEAWEHAEQKTIEVAQKLQRAEGSEAEIEELQPELRAAVERAFSARRMLQEARMNEMQSKLSQIKSALQSREQRRDRIIERRVEELQDPGLNWQSFRSTDRTSNTSRTGLGGGRRVPAGRSVGVSLKGPGQGMPEIGTPVGLPGPPNMPLAPADASIVVDLYGGEDVLPQMNTDGPNKAKHVKLLQELNAIEGVVVNILQSGPGNEILLAIVRDPTAGAKNIPRELSQRRMAIARALEPIPGVRWEVGATEANAAETVDSQDGETIPSPVKEKTDDPKGRTGANTSADPEYSSAPAFSSSSPIAASSLRAFDWEKADSVQTMLNTCQRQLHDERSRIDATIKTIDQLRTPWQDGSEAQRKNVEKILRSPSGRFGGGFGGTPGQAGAPDSIAEKEERYEKLRLERLQSECRHLEKCLREADGALDGLSRYWQRYQGTLSDLQLILREAELVLDAASQIEEIEVSREKLGVGDRSKNINARVAAERARINVERATRYVKQMERIGNEHPQFEPTQYREHLQQTRQLLDRVRKEHPELETITAPGGTGGGFF